MPVEFLGKDQVAGYGAFVEAPSQEDLERFFFLDDEDRRLVNRRRREHNRLGFGVQVGTVRMLGRFLDEPMAVPNAVVDYVADQLGIEDLACTSAYGERSKTTLEHEWEIRRDYCYRDFSAAQDELSIWLEARAWTTGLGPKALFDATVEWLLKRKVLLPGVTTLTRFVVRVREQATHRLWEFLFKQVSDDQKRQLSELLTVESEERTSRFERLRKGPVRVSGRELKRALIRVAEIRELGFSDLDIAVPPRRLLELSRRGHASSVSQLRRLPDQRRYATLLATVRHLHTRAIDDALDLFDVLMGTKLIARVGRETRNERIRTFPKLVEASSKLASAVRTLLSADCETSVGDVLNSEADRSEGFFLGSRDSAKRGGAPNARG